MKIAIILCTYSRAQSLARALGSVASSMVPDDVTWEVLVIDNNSSDNTRDIVQNIRDRHPGIFRYIFEPKPGKSNALNRAIRETDADVLAFMDDDVRVEPDWLHKLTRIFADPCYSGSGGRIVPDSAFTLPIWLGTSERYALAPLAMFDLGLEPGELKEPPFGTNMAFRREMFTRYGDFRCDLGPQPGSEIRSEDTEFGVRVLSGGERLWYEPAAVVHHSVPQSRVTRSYFLAWWYGKGRGDIRESNGDIDHQRNWARFSLVLIRRIIVWTLRWLFTFNPARRFSCQAKVWWLSGKLRETLVESRRIPGQPVSEPRSAQ